MVSIGRPSRRPAAGRSLVGVLAKHETFAVACVLSPRGTATGPGASRCDRRRFARAASARRRARANVHHVLVPLMSQPPSVFVALVVTPATSLPKSGSVTATAARTSPEARRGSQRSFCSWVPPFTSARVKISGRVISDPPMPRAPHDSSSVATTMPRYSDSPPVAKPPNSSGTERPKPPSSARPEITDSGMSALARWTCSACGRTCSSANRWKVSATISKSSPR